MPVSIDDAGRPTADVVAAYVPESVRRVFRAANHELDDRWEEPELGIVGQFSAPFEDFPATDPINAERMEAAQGRVFEGVYISITIRGTHMSIACRGDVNNHLLNDLMRSYDLVATPTGHEFARPLRQ